jgi:hypothetical protein
MDTHKNEPAGGSCWTALGHGVQATWSLVSIYDPRRASRSVVIRRCLSLADSVEKVLAAVGAKFLRPADAFDAVRHGGPQLPEQNLSATFFFT